MRTYIYDDNLESVRLRTRKLTEKDIIPWTSFFIDKEAVEFIPTLGMTSPQERAKHWISKQIDRYADNRFGLQALIDKQSNEFIGQCGLLTQVVDGITELEVGYHIFKKHWGQGFAPEAAKLFIDFAFKTNQANSIISIIDKGNIKSQRVAEKNSLLRVKETRWSNQDVYIYRRHQKPELNAKK